MVVSTLAAALAAVAALVSVILSFVQWHSQRTAQRILQAEREYSRWIKDPGVHALERLRDEVLPALEGDPGVLGDEDRATVQTKVIQREIPRLDNPLNAGARTLGLDRFAEQVHAAVQALEDDLTAEMEKALASECDAAFSEVVMKHTGIIGQLILDNDPGYEACRSEMVPKKLKGSN